MSVPVFIMGDPGSGKSYSMRNFSADEAAIIQTIPKMMPFKTDIEIAATTNIAEAKKWAMALKNKPVIIFDDFGYFITNEWANGNSKGFDVYKKIGTDVYNFIVDIMTDGIPERIAYFVMHEERLDNGTVQPLTLGKLLNEKIKLMGLFTVALHAIYNGEKYVFVTNGQPFKSPPGMFDLEIPNDLKFVDTAIRNYYEFGKNEKELVKSTEGKSEKDDADETAQET